MESLLLPWMDAFLAVPTSDRWLPRSRASFACTLVSGTVRYIATDFTILSNDHFTCRKVLFTGVLLESCDGVLEQEMTTMERGPEHQMLR